MPSPPGRTARSSSKSSRIADQGWEPPLPLAPPDPATIPVAVVLGAHGLRGQLRVRPFLADSPSITPGAELVLEHPAGWRHVQVTSVSSQGQNLLVQIHGLDDRTAAERLGRAVLRVHPDHLPPLGPDEFYHHEVVGFAVVTTDGRTLGSITETLQTGLNDVWVVRDDGREYLIPVIADVVRTIDRTARRIEIDPLPGLLD